MTLSDWLAQEVEYTAEYCVPVKMALGDLLADLCVRNGGMNVNAWGVIAGAGPGCGLDQGDALTLIRLSGIFEGFTLCGESSDAFSSYFAKRLAAEDQAS